MRAFKELKFPLFTKFATTPAIPAVIWLITGFLCVAPQRSISHYWLLFVTAMFLSTLTFLYCIRPYRRYLMLLPVGIILMYCSLHPPTQTYLKHLPRDECHATISGLITEVKQTENSQRLIVQLNEMTCYNETRQVKGKILIPIPNFSPPPQKLSPGMTFSAEGAFLLPTLYPQFNEKNYLSSQRIFRKFSVTRWHDIRQPHTLFQRLLSRWDSYKISLNERLLKGLQDNDYCSMLSAMILGIRSDISQDIKQQFVLAGTIHLLAVSGLHAAAIAWIIMSILKLIKTNYLKQWYLLIAILGGYVLMTGLSPSASRTWLMIFIFSLGKIKCRYISPLQSIAAAALIQLVLNPCLIFNSGFQYSYLIVTSLIISLPLITKFYNMLTVNHFWLPIHLNAGTKIHRTLFSCLAGSTIAWAAAVGLTLLYNQIFIPFSIALNVIVIHLATFLLSGGILKILIADIPPLCKLVNLLLDNLLDIIRLLNNLCDSVPGSVIYSARFPLWAALIYLLLFFGFLLTKHKLKFLISMCLLIGFFLIHPHYRHTPQHYLSYGCGGNLYSPVLILKSAGFPPIIITTPTNRNLLQATEFLTTSGQIPREIYYLQQVRVKLPDNQPTHFESATIKHIHCVKNDNEVIWSIPDLDMTIKESPFGQWTCTYQGQIYEMIPSNEISWRTIQLSPFQSNIRN